MDAHAALNTIWMARLPDVVAEFDISTMPEKLQRYWTEGEGGVRIGWGTPGDFDRCRTNLRAEGVPGRMVDGACANLHKRATGSWPGDKKGAHAMDPIIEDYPNLTASLVAGASIDAFQDPGFGAPGEDPRLVLQPPAIECSNKSHHGLSLVGHQWACDTCHTVTEDARYGCPLTILDDGRVFGHAALWGTCHIGFDGACVTPPPSMSGYAHFLTGEYTTPQGDTLPVGTITLGTGHAAAQLGARPAVAHYDNTGLAAAYVTAGEDAYGIWVAGATADGVTPTQVQQLRGSSISGDWRRIGGALDMVAALAVNVPGFPISRLTAATTARKPSALVASGIVVRDTPQPAGVAHVTVDTETLVASATKRLRGIFTLDSRLANLDRRLGVDRDSRLNQADRLIERN